MTTVYRIRDNRGNTHTTEDAERAGRLSRAGLHVTAATVDR